jgi:hypothetical protein
MCQSAHFMKKHCSSSQARLRVWIDSIPPVNCRLREFLHQSLQGIGKISLHLLAADLIASFLLGFAEL